jgi:redox-sensitive bicupin YhaK (pirin superfamily)
MLTAPPVAMVVGPRFRHLGAFHVNRVWPTARRRVVGPFIFFDHLLPARLGLGQGLDVPPHPHIGLATVTYLFRGELLHRDSLGIEQLIRPGEVNWMTAGRGIVHSERSPAAARVGGSRLHGIQIWVALPLEQEITEPGFDHFGAAQIPRTTLDGARITVVAGTAFGLRSPVRTSSDLFYLEADLDGGQVLHLESSLGQRAAYIVDGSVTVGDRRYESGRLLVFEDLAHAALHAAGSAKLMVFGGAALSEERHVWWNFVSSSPDRIEAAKSAWRAREFPVVPGDDDYMPMPD